MKNKVTYIILLALLSMVVSCKKDKLNGNYSILEGDWRWNYTVRKTYTSATSYFTDTIRSSNSQINYALNFAKKGKLSLLEDGEKTHCYRIVFDVFTSSGSCGNITNAHTFGIRLNNKDDQSFIGCVNSDTLLSNYELFPFENQETPTTIIHTNYYLRE